MTVYAFTGHRPKDLPAWYNNHRFNEDVSDYRFSSSTGSDDQFVTGGALGIDTMAAHYAIERNIPLTLILPFDPAVMTKFWPKDDQDTLRSHASFAQELFVLSDHYDPRYYQQRNIAMIDRCDVLLAFWSGKRHGGTFNAIEYARSINKRTMNLLGKQERIV